jgi:hypothetical protein
LVAPDDDVIQSSVELHSGFSSSHATIVTIKVPKVQTQA